jgi:hypothetical protein
MATAAAGPERTGMHVLLKQWRMMGARRALIEVIVKRNAEEKKNVSM